MNAKIENQMTEITGASPDLCENCHVKVWADGEIGCYVDSRMVTDSCGTRYLFCGDTTVGHTV